MGVESPRWGKFAKLMADHIFADKDENKLPAVMHADRAPDHLGSHRGAPRPSANDLPLTRLAHCANFL